MNIQPKIVILSAALAGKDKLDNIGRTDRLRSMLTDLHYVNGQFSGFMPATGVHNDKYEDSFIVALHDDCWEFELEMLKGFALENFGQEAVLFSDANRHTELHFKDSTESIGRLIGVSKEVAEQEKNYTFREVKENGIVTDTYYYITKRLN